MKWAPEGRSRNDVDSGSSGDAPVVFADELVDVEQQLVDGLDARVNLEVEDVLQDAAAVGVDCEAEDVSLEEAEDEGRARGAEREHDRRDDVVRVRVLQAEREVLFELERGGRGDVGGQVLERLLHDAAAVRVQRERQHVARERRRHERDALARRARL